VWLGGLCVFLVLDFWAAVVQFGGVEAGTVLELIPLWGGRTSQISVQRCTLVCGSIGRRRVSQTA